MRFPPLGGLCLYTPQMRFFPLEGVNADMPTSFFSAILWESKPSADWIVPTQIPPLCCWDFPLSEIPFDVPLI